jgi:CheY-like chemotaxis protein
MLGRKVSQPAVSSLQLSYGDEKKIPKDRKEGRTEDPAYSFSNDIGLATRQELDVLAVDDDLPVRESLRTVLRFLGLTSAICADGFHAIEVAKTMKVKCALVDIRMPRMNGVAVLKALKEIDPDIKVLMMTAISSENVEHEAMCAGAEVIIHKPFRLEEIKARLAEFL